MTAVVWELTRLRRALRPLGRATTLIKGNVAAEPAAGLVPGFSASGQDVWLEVAQFTGPGLVLSAVGARCGKVFEAAGKWGVVANTVPLKPMPGYDAHFLWYLVNNEAFWEKGGAAQPYVRVSETLDSRIPLPPLKQQRAIADYLDAEIARIDALTRAKHRMLATLQARWEAELEIGIGGQWARAAILQGLTVPIPAGWRIDKLLHLLDPSIPLVYGILLTGPHVDDGVPFIGAGDVKAGRLSLNELPRTTKEIASAYPRSRMRPGELVYAIRGSFGAVAQVSPELDGTNLSRDAARIAPAANVHPRWLMYALRSHVAQEQFARREVGVAVTGVNIGDLKQVRLPVPPPDRQEAIASALDERSEVYERVVDCHQRQIQLLMGRRQSLIDAAVKGQPGIPGIAA